MSGFAKTTKFMLGSAEVMLGPEADLFDLTTEHSLGLVKDFNLSQSPQTIALPRGLRAMATRSVRAGSPLRGTAQVYEYTAKNVSYAAGLTAPVEPQGASTTTVPIAVGDVAITVDDASYFIPGTHICITKGGVLVSRQIQSVAGSVLTLTQPMSVAFAVNAIVMTATAVGLGVPASTPVFSARITSTLADSTPIEIQLPRVAVTGDLSLLFSTESYTPFPMTFECFESRPGDIHYAVFGRLPGRLIIGSHSESFVTLGLGSVFWDNFASWDNSRLWN